jgi:hypothetical protein
LLILGHKSSLYRGLGSALHFGLALGKGKGEFTPLAYFTFNGNGPIMAFRNFVANSQTHACARILAHFVQALEGLKDAGAMPGVKANAIIFNRDLIIPVIWTDATVNLNDRRHIFGPIF